MKFALLGRQALMGVMAVALVAGMSVKTFAAENLLSETGTLKDRVVRGADSLLAARIVLG